MIEIEEPNPKQAQHLLDLIREMSIYCQDRTNFDKDVFKLKTKTFTDSYKRVNYATQGEYHHLWLQELTKD